MLKNHVNHFVSFATYKTPLPGGPPCAVVSRPNGARVRVLSLSAPSIFAWDHIFGVFAAYRLKRLQAPWYLWKSWPAIHSQVVAAPKLLDLTVANSEFGVNIQACIRISLRGRPGLKCCVRTPWYLRNQVLKLQKTFPISLAKFYCRK